jgi:hypothetical protein
MLIAASLVPGSGLEADGATRKCAAADEQDDQSEHCGAEPQSGTDGGEKRDHDGKAAAERRQ